jgi:uncharacterized protein with PQ loop repeat
MVRRDIKQLTERLALVVGVLQPLTTVPQIMLIEKTRDVAGVSVLTWLLSALSGLAFLVYGVVHRLRPVVVTQVLWFVLQMIVVIQVISHG